MGQGQHLRVDPGQDAGQDIGPQPLEVADRGPGQRLRDPVAQRHRGFVSGAAEAELGVGNGVRHELATAQQPGPIRRAPELKRRGPLHQGLIEIEERGAYRRGPVAIRH